MRLNSKQPSYKKTKLLLASGLVALMSIGCSSPQLSNASEKPTSSKKSSAPVKAKTVSKFGGEESAPKILKKMNRQEQQLFAREDLAKRLGVTMEETSVSGAIQVTWRSGALGCPKPGMNYTDALVPGVLIMVKVGNTAHRYHGSPGRQPFYCPESLAESQYLNSGDI